MTEGQRLIEMERDRNRYLAAKDKMNLPSSGESNTSPTLFEHVMHEHVQAEVERLIGRISTVGMNTSEGYMELGPEHRAPIHTTFDDMLEFDEQINNTGDDLDESHQEDMQDGIFLTNFKTQTCLQGVMSATWIRKHSAGGDGM
ncbi:hypothetical protein MKX03_034591 [Papaver bracteatum]|nr:hypothetical protein MKX03_034591 [Papaver bracteatum]